MAKIVTLKERKARALAARRAAHDRLLPRLADEAARYGGRDILFGSAARGEMHAHSDLDLLVIKERLGPRRGETSGRIRGRLPAQRRAVDILLLSPEEVEQNRAEVYQPVGQALAHGKTIYERQ